MALIMIEARGGRRGGRSRAQPVTERCRFNSREPDSGRGSALKSRLGVRIMWDSFEPHAASPPSSLATEISTSKEQSPPLPPPARAAAVAQTSAGRLSQVQAEATHFYLFAKMSLLVPAVPTIVS